MNCNGSVSVWRCHAALCTNSYCVQTYWSVSRSAQAHRAYKKPPDADELKLALPRPRAPITWYDILSCSTNSQLGGRDGKLLDCSWPSSPLSGGQAQKLDLVHTQFERTSRCEEIIPNSGEHSSLKPDSIPIKPLTFLLMQLMNCGPRCFERQEVCACDGHFTWNTGSPLTRYWWFFTQFVLKLLGKRGFYILLWYHSFHVFFPSGKLIDKYSTCYLLRNCITQHR